VKLLRVRASGVAGLPEIAATLESGREPAAVVAVQGPPGSGKSRLLDLLVHCKERIGAYGPLAPDRSFATDAHPARVDLAFWLDADERRFTGAPTQVIPCEVAIPAPRGLQLPTDPALVDVLARFELSAEHAKVEYFRSDRAAGQSQTTAGDARAEQKRLRLGSSAKKLASLKLLATQTLSTRSQQGQVLRDLFREATGCVLLSSPERGLQVQKRGPHVVSLTELSASEWDAFVVTASIVLLGLSRSLIFYDTPELHLPAAEALRRFTLYRRAAPNAQWIVATNDAGIAREADVTLNLGGPVV
jgi:hypothetical protein